jgi:hypothetical protein
LWGRNIFKWSEISIKSSAKKLYSKIDERARFAFVSAFVTGFITHCFSFFNLYLNHDGIKNIYGFTDMTSSGRWLLKPACLLSGDACLPVIIGLLSILYLSAACALITEMFKVQNKGFIALISAFIVTFPSVTKTFTYMFTADGYMLSFLLAAAAVFLAKRRRFGFLPASLLVCLSLGIYQASVSVCIILFMLVIAIDILDGEKTKQIYIGISKYISCGVLGCGLYYAALKAIIAIKGVALTNYKGADKLSLDLNSLKNAVVNLIPKNLALILADGQFGFCGKKFLGVSLAALTMIAVVLVLLRANSMKLYKRPLVFLFLPVLFFSLPFMMFCILFISPGAGYYAVMLSSFSIVFAALPIIFDRYLSVSSLITFLHKYLMVALSVLFISHFVIFANFTYVRGAVQAKNTEALMTNIVSELYAIDNFTKKPLIITSRSYDKEGGKGPNYMSERARYIFLGFVKYEASAEDFIYEDLTIYLKLYYGLDCTPMKHAQFTEIKQKCAGKLDDSAADTGRAYDIFEYDGKIIIVLNNYLK